MTAFTIVGLAEPHTLTAAETEVATAAILLLASDAVPGSPALQLVGAKGDVLVPRLDSPNRLSWFKEATGIHLNQFLRAHRMEIAAALQSIAPPIEQASRLARTLQLVEESHV